jgi:hypothetical protein
MSQVPPGPSNPDLPAAYPAQTPHQRGSGLWKWILGITGLIIFVPCVCCGGCTAYLATIKDLAITNGEHLGGSPMNVKVDYVFQVDEHRGLTKNYHMVVQAANGTRRERTVVGGGFGFQRIPVRGTWHFGNAVDLGPDQNKKFVQVWIEAEDENGGRSTASNTLTIYPKS